LVANNATHSSATDCSYSTAIGQDCTANGTNTSAYGSVLIALGHARTATQPSQQSNHSDVDGEFIDRFHKISSFLNKYLQICLI
jgi:hypothetical protein